MIDVRDMDQALLRGQRRVLELLTRRAPIRDSLTALCDMIEERLPRALCSVLLLDAGAGTLHHGAAPRLPSAYCAAIDGVHIGPRVGSCGTAAYEHRVVAVEDIATDPLWVDFREVAARHGLAACLSVPIIDAGGEVLGTFAIYHHEVGPFQDADLALLRDASSLAMLVIANERREDALRVSEEAVRQTQKLDSLGLLAGGIAHDFNNLLATMLVNLNLAELKLTGDSAALPFVKNAEATVLHAAELTKQMLAYSGRGRFVVKDVDVSVLVAEVTQLLSITFPKNVTLRLELAPDLPVVAADVAQFHQVLMNLVTNAAEAIGGEQGVVTVTTGVEDLDVAVATTFAGRPLLPGRYATMTVSDTGCGMEPAVLSRIFDPFFSTKRAGRGLGLCAMIGILRGHRAGLQIDSVPGRGSTFKVFFPSRDRGVAAAPLEPTDDSTIRPAGLALVVDDEPSLRRGVAELVRELGLEVVEAEDGLEAVALVRQRGAVLALVLMDVTMPKMDGWEAFQAIRAFDAAVPVILCSGYDKPDAFVAIEAQGAVGFLQKPYGLTELRAAFRAVGAGRHQA